MSDTIAKHREYLFPAVATCYQEPLALVRGEGMYVWDERGVLIGKGGLYGNVIRTGMPLIATRDHVDELVAALDESLAAV